MGVAIRDSNGNMPRQLHHHAGVNEHLASMQEGTARNVEGQRIYGKAWESIAPSIRITGEAMEEARVKAESLGLVVGKEGIAQATEYRKAMAGVHTVFDGIEKAIGDALIPVLTRLAQWFEKRGSAGRADHQGRHRRPRRRLREPDGGGLHVRRGHRGRLEYVTTYIVTAINVIAEALAHPFSGKRHGGVGRRHGEDRSRRGTPRRQHQEGVGGCRADRRRRQRENGVTRYADRRQAGNGDYRGRQAGKSRTGEWQTALEEKKAAYQEAAAAQGQLLEFSRQQEIQYWQQILATTTTTLEERKQIHAKMAADELAIDKAQLEGSLAR